MPRDWKSLKCAETWKLTQKDDLHHKEIENDSIDSDTDPEEAAERDYARQNGLPMPVARAHSTDSSPPEIEKKKQPIAKVNQAKAARKARGRGVSGSMTKKQKSVTNDDWDALYDDYDFIEPDESYEDGRKFVAEVDENDFNGFFLNENTADFVQKNYTSDATIDSQLKQQLSLEEPTKGLIINEEVPLQTDLSVASGDLKM